MIKNNLKDINYVYFCRTEHAKNKNVSKGLESFFNINNFGAKRRFVKIRNSNSYHINLNFVF